MKQALLILAAAAAVLLGGCEPSNPPKPRPHHREPGTLYKRPDCGAPDIRFVHQRICENKSLDYLDRMLQIQWGDARKTADSERSRELDEQQDRFLRERHACQGKDKDDADICIAGVYHRYLTPEATSTPAPAPKPKPSWTPKPVPAPAPKPHWTPKPRWTPSPAPENDGPAPQSCAARMGPGAAGRLMAQCRRVNQGNGWSCGPERSCGQLRQAISRGCNETYRKPRFCPSL